MIKFLNIILSIILILFQQGLVIALGLLIYSQNSKNIGVIILLLCIPMLYINYLTYKQVTKHGIANFLSINADTSEIDINKDERWYNKNDQKK